MSLLSLLLCTASCGGRVTSEELGQAGRVGASGGAAGGHSGGNTSVGGAAAEFDGGASPTSCAETSGACVLLAQHPPEEGRSRDARVCSHGRDLLLDWASQCAELGCGMVTIQFDAVGCVSGLEDVLHGADPAWRSCVESLARLGCYPCASGLRVFAHARCTLE